MFLSKLRRMNVTGRKTKQNKPTNKKQQTPKCVCWGGGGWERAGGDGGGGGGGGRAETNIGKTQTEQTKTKTHQKGSSLLTHIIVYGKQLFYRDSGENKNTVVYLRIDNESRVTDELFRDYWGVLTLLPPPLPSPPPPIPLGLIYPLPPPSHMFADDTTLLTTGKSVVQIQKTATALSWSYFSVVQR